jgi:hypothetical protein
MKQALKQNTCGIMQAIMYLLSNYPAKAFHVQNPTFSTAVTLYTQSPMKMEQTERSETLAFKLQTPGNNPEENI